MQQHSGFLHKHRFPCESFVYLKKYGQLRGEYRKTKLNKMLLVPVPGDSATVKKAVLTKFIRAILQLVGVSSNSFHQAVDPNDPKAAGGAEYAMLCKHYEYVLQVRCGIDLDLGLGCYLRSMRIHDTTTDFYWCLSDQSGNHFLQTIMRRDWLLPLQSQEATQKISSKLTDEKTTREVTVSPGGSEEKTGALTKKRIFVPAGTELVLASKHGLAGIIHFTEDPKQANCNEY